MNVITKTLQLADGRTITIETGKVAKQTDGSVVLRMNNTVLLATVCAAKDAVPGTDFMPLQVDYREQYSAAGRFPGGFTKREGKASDGEILTSRLVDRVLRPLFPSNYHAEVFVNVMLLSADGVDQPDALAGFAASAALACSDIPFECPISEVRVARINGEYVIDPTFEQMKSADMDIMVGASAENIMMVEGEMDEVSEQDLLGALKAAMVAIKPMCELQAELSKELGKDVKREYDHEVNDEALRERMNKELYQPAYDITKQALEKQARAEAFEKILADFKEKFFEEKHAETVEDAENEISDEEYDQLKAIGAAFENMSLELIRNPEQNLWEWADVQGPERNVALIADVYTANADNNPDKSILYEGVGQADEIYVVVEIKGYLYLMRGGVFSYRELTRPCGEQRMNDEEWQQKLEKEPRLGVPKWMEEIILPLDQAPVDNEEVFYSSGC